MKQAQITIYYLRFYSTKLYFDNHPQLSQDLIRLLCEKKIRFIGIDCAGIRQHSEHEEADRVCERNGVYVIENLCNLNQIIEKTFTVYTMWLDDEVMTGLKCRVIVEVQFRLQEQISSYFQINQVVQR